MWCIKLTSDILLVNTFGIKLVLIALPLRIRLRLGNICKMGGAKFITTCVIQPYYAVLDSAEFLT